ncbi:phytanoyl-CoA dioxygenase PhyH [Kribbella amoyensis]|uniref:Phytanoyl-CoA dioxygenase PhyH n=1 Tax=Kribbella amoyensis TaxID=996641 RepID=A0A561C058_9ACTN|nr:phytanoyl-CoA dioxygenase family protein [Kribbella amoyensis]TWD84576.1 phytanoyl-CoA dioxygenase PhyH [Kribbella amoyensis]
MTVTEIGDPETLQRGYVLIEDLLTPAECEEIGERLLEYARGDRQASGRLQVQREPALVRSGQEVAPGQDVRKVGGLWDDELIRRELITRPSVVGRIQSILGEQLWLYRADALMKPGKVGSEKGFHQDSPYWPIQPMSLWSCWLPLDDATIENGCMLVVPGSHAGGGLPHESTLDDYVIPESHYDLDAVVPVPMRRGSGLFFHSLVVHATAANTSGKSRRAITMSYFGAEHRHVGAEEPPEYPVVAP